jgi:hypothetical protein
MLRRIPIVPMLFGTFAAWTLLAMLASRDRSLSDTRIYAVSGAFGAAYILLAYWLLRALPSPNSRAGSIGFGCLFAWLAVFFAASVVGVVSVLVSGRGITLYGVGPGIMTVIAFWGLGILGGLMWDRLRRAEAERQAAALERQQLELARDLQQRLLPPAPVESDLYRVSARNVPATYVAGDFYDVIPLQSGGVLIAVADVAGKGVAAGLVMATIKGMLPLLIVENPDPAALIRQINRRIARQLTRRQFVAIVVAVVAPNGRIAIANAGMPDPLHVASRADPLIVPGPRYPTGIRDDVEYQTLALQLAGGDRVLFFSDGLPEAQIESEPVGYERMALEARLARGEVDAVFQRLDAAGATHDDDWTAVTLEWIRKTSTA